jgi:hypothetical protein
MNDKRWYVMARLDLTDQGQAVLSSVELLSTDNPAVAGGTVWLSVSREGPATWEEARDTMHEFMRFPGKFMGLIPAYVDPADPLDPVCPWYTRPLPCGHPGNARKWMGDTLGPCRLCEKSSAQSP